MSILLIGFSSATPMKLVGNRTPLDYQQYNAVIHYNVNNNGKNVTRDDSAFFPKNKKVFAQGAKRHETNLHVVSHVDESIT
jgi:hypothetical protein